MEPVINKARAWAVTIHIKCMKNAGLTDEDINNPQYVAEYFRKLWEESGKDRQACVATCVSKIGLLHLHAALYGPPTTRNAVAKCLYNPHIEALEAKAAMSDYVMKIGRYAEKDEEILYITGEENLTFNQGHRSDLDIIKTMLDEGMNPDQIMGENLRYRRYKRMITEEYDYRNRMAAFRNVKRNMYRVWHFGEFDSGMEYYTNELLCEKYGSENVYYMQYIGYGSFDKYSERGNPPVLVIGDVDQDTDLRDLMNIFDEYTNTLIKCRYNDITPMWKEVHINSYYSPEQYAGIMRANKDKYKKFFSKLDYVVYHYVENGEYKKYEIPAKDYIDKTNLLARIQLKKEK